MKIDDAEYLEKLYPDTKRLKDIYEKARVDNISISRKFNALLDINKPKNDYHLINLPINPSNFVLVDTKYFRFSSKVSADDGYYIIMDIGREFIVKHNGKP